MLTVLNSAVQQQPRAAAVAKQVQLPSSRSQFRIRTINGNDTVNSSIAAELQALLCEMSNSTSNSALLHEPQLVDIVRALAAGDTDKVTQYAGGKQAITALAHLLDPLVTPQQQQVLAAAAAAAHPPKLSPQEEALLLLQEPLVSTAMRRMRSNPQLGFSSYGQNPEVLKALNLLVQVLTEDAPTSQLVDFMQTAAAAAAADASRVRVPTYSTTRQQPPPPPQQQQQHSARSRPLHNDQQQQQQQPQQQPAPQRQRQMARTAVIARSATTHDSPAAGASASKGSSSSSGGGGAAAAGPTARGTAAQH